jgi:hypothetical protein
MLELLLLLGLYLVLTGLSGVATALAGARRGIVSIPVLLGLALAASGTGAMIAFWAYYADPLAGESFSFLLVFGSVALIGWALHGRRLDPALLRELATPLALWALGSAFVLLLGFAHGGTDSSLATSSIRFSHQLPADNYIPQFYAEWFYENGHRGTPPVFPVEWLSSDRPPLQIGYVLAERPFGRGGDDLLRYQVLGVVLQQLWIVGLWALLLAARVGRVTRALAALAVLASPVAIVNGFYVWPKLLPAAMLLAAAALVLTPLWSEVRRTAWGAALLAALLALALLGHGSSVFGVIPLALIAAFRGMPSWRWIGVGLLVGVVAMAPWFAYQAYGDPPGNRLVKWMLAGVTEVDDRGSGETIVDSYGEIGVGGALDNKVDNFVAMAGGEPLVENVDNAIDAAGEGDPEGALRAIRTIFFFNLLPGLGLLLVVPVAMALAWRRDGGRSAEWSFALVCLGAFLLGAIGWGLLMFGGLAAETVVHQGSYLLPVLGLCGAVAGLRAGFPRFAVGVTVVNALLMLALYAPALDPPEGSSYSALAVLAAIAALVAFVAVGLRGVAPSAPSTP